MRGDAGRTIPRSVRRALIFIATRFLLPGTSSHSSTGARSLKPTADSPLAGAGRTLPYDMLRHSIALAAVFILSATVPFRANNEARVQSKGSAKASVTVNLHTSRTSPLDLELGGELAHFAAGSTLYITREDLLAFPQVAYTVANDPNFIRPMQISGVALEELVRQLATERKSDMVVAISSDKYHANYPRDYIAAHHPVLALTVNGQPPSGWPKHSEGYNLDMGPYLISHPNFTPGFEILAHAEEAQIPWGVVRLEFRDERAVFGSVAPCGPRAQQTTVQAGYRIAQQNCFRCHNMGAEGGQKAGRPWGVLSTWATASPEYFAAYVHNPKSKNPRAQMPGFPEYDGATLDALTMYFRTFTTVNKP
jgi:mono/diheme cytochrome c family protein